MSKDILYPLRQLHGWLVEKRIEHAKKTTLRNELSDKNGTIVVIPGTPEHTNLGDSAIVLAQVAFFKKCGLPEMRIKQTSFSQHIKYRKTITQNISKNTLIAHLGGGNMGSQWKIEEDFHRAIVQDFPKNPMLIFPQTIYYADGTTAQLEESKRIYNNHKRLTIVAREDSSSKTFRTLYPNVDHLLTPDIVLSATIETFGAKPQERDSILLCMRSDAERAMTDDSRKAIELAITEAGESFRYTDMYATKAVTKENRADCVKEKMEELASAKLVITDRLHGMVFAAITGTPCIAFGNYNHKVSGTYDWIKYLPYVKYAETVEQAKSWIPELLEMGGQVYDNTPLMPYFDKLAQVVRKYANN